MSFLDFLKEMIGTKKYLIRVIREASKPA